jgi:hypothetical protein
MNQQRFAALLAAVALAVFTGTALAGNDHGNAPGNGNSGNAPGHQQQPQSQPAAAPAASPATQPSAPAKNAGKHADKAQSKQSSTSASQPATGGDNSQGVKPSNTTKHNTYAKASSDKTKQYGNGKTAGQIATQAGFGNATLHGPGNSQPHKTMCGAHEVDVHALKHKAAKCSAAESSGASTKKVKTESQKVEVAKTESKESEAAKSESHAVSQSARQHVTICHATGSSSHPFVMISPSASGVFHGHLRHQDGRDIVPPFTFKGQAFSENWNAEGQAIFNNGCSAVASSSSTESASSAAEAASSSSPAASGGGVAGSAQVASAPAGSAAPTAASPASAGGVKGAAVTLRPTKTKASGGVLGTTTRLGGTIASSRLPFTGLPLWIFALVALALIAVGLGIRRTSTNRI